MESWLIEAIGLVAGVLTTLSFIPQVVKIWRSRSAEDISTTMFLLFLVGILLWLLYGLLRDSLAIILANSVTIVLVVAILVLKYRFSRTPPLHTHPK